MYVAMDIAFWFAGSVDQESGDSITHLKLQKLVYYAQAWSLALRGEPLFEEDFQAWAHGPVVESIYRHYEGIGWNALPCPDSVPVFPEAIETHLSEVLDSYGKFSAKQLERMTHAEAPWREARGDLAPEARSNSPISKEAMREFYSALYKQSDGNE